MTSEYLKRLEQIRQDKDQERAFNHDKSCVVIAGPGSGKTYLLTMKIAKLLFEEVHPPRKVACITYSRLLARELKIELRKLGVFDESRLFVGTVHGFCLGEIVMPYQHLFDEDLKIPQPLRIASENERENAIRFAFKKSEPKLITFDNYRRNPEEKWEQQIKKYLQVLHQINKSTDFVEIELIAMKAIKRYKFLRDMLEACYPWLVIDEYQDLTTPFHYMVTSLLEHTSIKIFAIGDPHQCIYESLSGSNPWYIQELADKTKSEITLQTNYRCPQNIITHSEKVLAEKLVYQTDDESKIGNIFQNESSLEKILSALVNENSNLDKIAILHRYRKQPKKYKYSYSWLLKIAEFLDNRGFNHSLDKPQYYDSCEVTEWFEQMAQWCVSGGQNSDVAFDDIVSFWHALNKESNQSYFELEVNLFDVLWSLRTETQLKAWLETLEKKLELSKLVEAYGKIYPDDTTQFKELSNSIKNGAMGNWTLNKFAKIPKGIQLTTVYSSKGTQFETVIIVDYQLIEDKKLAYVGVTRAKKNLYLSVSI